MIVEVFMASTNGMFRTNVIFFADILWKISFSLSYRNIQHRLPMIRCFSCLTLLFCLLSYQRGIAGDSLPSPCMQKAEKLLDEVLGFMQKTYYRREQVSWP